MTDHQKKSHMPLHTRIVLALVIGAVLGLSANVVGGRLADPQGGSRLTQDADANGMADVVESIAQGFADPVGRIFLRLILMVILPLVICALVLGVVEIGDVRKLGRLGLRTLGLTAVLSSIAVGLGLLMVNTLRPGHSLGEEQRTALQSQYSSTATDAVTKARQAKTIQQTLLDLIPENPLQEMAGALDGSSKGNGMLAVMCFALIIGVALTVVPRERTGTLIACIEGMFEVAMAVIRFAMWLAPVAVACLVFAITARLGFDIVRTLGLFVVTVLLGLGLQLFVVYSIAIATLGGLSPSQFFIGAREAMLTAFGTSSSSATLPTALRVAEQELKLPREVGQFVLTVGATANQNGTALYEGVVVLFLAQVFGVELTLAQQILVVLMSILAGVGTAGVPGGSLPMIVVVLQSVGVPGEGIGIILGIDRFLDMCRTVLNVTGDLVLAACVANWERGRAASSGGNAA